MDNQIRTAPKKNSTIEYMRAISMVMIVLCHYFSYYGNELAWWFNIGVQIFFLISGFLYGGRPMNDPIHFIAKQFKKILIPYYIFIIPTMVFYFLFARETLSLTVVAGTLEGIEHLWFVPYILLCYVVNPYLYWFTEKMKALSFLKMTVSFVVLLGAVLVLGTAFDSFFLPDRIVCYLVGYFIAIYYQKYGQEAFKALAAVSIPIGTVASAIRVYFEYGLGWVKGTNWWPIASLYQRASRVLLGIALFFALYLLLQKTKPNKVGGVVGRYSYSIYIVHQLFILGVGSVMEITSVTVLNWLIVLVAIIVSAILLQFVTDKINKLAK